MNKRVEWLLLVLILAVGAWLRFSRLDLVEFKGDEAVAAFLALKFVKTGTLPLAGLMSSVGVTNPPLFIYLLIPIMAISSSPVFVSCCIAALGLGAVAATWHVGRKYYGPVTGLVAASLFATAPWAVIYSRKIWAQDFVPVFAVATMWALHALVLGKRPKAVFWVLLLPLCVIQIHFSGLAFTATVVALLFLLQPVVDRRYAVAGVALAVVLTIPYLWFQGTNGWADFKKAAATVGGQKFNIPEGMTVHPDLGYALPRRDSWVHALSILNAGQIEDVMGLSARPELDPNRVWTATRGGAARYFDGTQRLGNSVLWLARLAFVAAFVYFGVQAVRSWRTEPGARALMLVLWVAGTLGVFLAARLWTYLSYFVVLYPAHFLMLGAVTEELLAKAKKKSKVPGLIVGGVVAVAVWNTGFVLDFYNFLGQYGGAHGTYGTVLAQKQEAVQWLVARADVTRLLAEGRIAQVDRLVPINQQEAVLLVDRPQHDLPFLAMLAQENPPAAVTPLPTNALVLVMDQNRTNFEPRQWPRWRLASPIQQGGQTGLALVPWNQSAGMTVANFGAIWIFVVQR